jgi:hypothetical protein
MNTYTSIFRYAAAVLVATALVSAVARPAHAQLGVAVGLNFDSISDIDTGSREATFENATGYHLGVFYDLAVGPVAIRPGVFYRRVQDVKVDILDAGAVLTESFDLSMVEVPIDLRLRLALPVIKPYLLAGPVIGFASTGEDDFEDALEELTVAANIGIGVELSLPGFTPTLFPEIRYAFGVSRFMKEDLTIGDIAFEAADAQRLNTLMLRLGITF